MGEDAIDAAARAAREILGSAGISHTIGTGADSEGTARVVVDVPYHVDRETVREKLGSINADVVVRHVQRSIIGQ